MYESYYGLKEKPFRLECKPEFLFPGKNFSEILAQLENAISERKELCAVSGLAGIGKTMLCESLLEKLQSGFICKMVTHSLENPTSPLHTILSAFGIDSAGQNEFELIGLGQAFLNRNYLKENLSAVLIVDDAHYLSEDQLGQFVSLIKLFSAERSLLRLILAGRPTLVEKIKRAGLPLTADRGPCLFELGPLTADETREFIVKRLRAVGSRRDNYFDQRACQSVFEYCRGIPRQINILCNVALEYGAIERAPRINQALIDDVAKDNGVDKFLLLCDEEQSNQPLWDDMSLASNIAADQASPRGIRTPDGDITEKSAGSKVPDPDGHGGRTEISGQPDDLPDGADEDKTKWDFLQTYRTETVKESKAEKNETSVAETQQPDDNAIKGKKLKFNYLDSYKEEPKQSGFAQHIDYEAEKTKDEESGETKQIVEDTLAPIPPKLDISAKAAVSERRNPIRKTGPAIAIAAGIAGVAITILLFQLLPLVVDPTKTADSYKQSPVGGLAETSENSGVDPGSRSSKELLAEVDSRDRLSGAAIGPNNQDGYSKQLSEKQAQRNERPATADISVFEQSDRQSLADRDGGLDSGSTRLEKGESKSMRRVSPSDVDSKPSAGQKTVGKNGRIEGSARDSVSNNRFSSVPNDGRIMTEEAAGAERGEAGENPVVRAISIEDRIQKLLARAEELYERRMLTTPVGGSALAAYQEVLLVNPNHPEALDGVRKIKQRYIDWAEEAEQSGDIRNVEHYLYKASLMDPRDGKLSRALQDARRDKTHPAEFDGAGNSPGKQVSTNDAVKRMVRRRQYVAPVYIEDVSHGLVSEGNPSFVFISATIHGFIDKAEVLVSTPSGFKPYSMYDDATHGDKVGNDGIYHTTVRLEKLTRVARFYIAAYTRTGGIIYNPPNADREPYRMRLRSVAGKEIDFPSQFSRAGVQEDARSTVTRDASKDR